MKSHLELTDVEFTTQFEQCKLAEELFTHEAHLRLAWIYLDSFGLEKAEKRICDSIQAYTAHLGVESIYNETVTIVAMKIVDHFQRQGPSLIFNEFLREYPELLTNFKRLVAQHYSADIFSNEAAKRNFIEPDLLPF